MMANHPGHEAVRQAQTMIPALSFTDGLKSSICLLPNTFHTSQNVSILSSSIHTTFFQLPLTYPCALSKTIERQRCFLFIYLLFLRVVAFSLQHCHTIIQYSVMLLNNAREAWGSLGISWGHFETSWSISHLALGIMFG
uniref:Uncharacterized protein n=1 Tax=Micrurus surinamensis TaxID=129470 RepID=A0A2D4NZF8_MICSU